MIAWGRVMGIGKSWESKIYPFLIITSSLFIVLFSEYSLVILLCISSSVYLKCYLNICGSLNQAKRLSGFSDLRITGPVSITS